MSIYGSIGFTRRDKTPLHWRSDYRLRTGAKKLLSQIDAERKEMYKAHEILSEDMSLSDEEYNLASREISAKLDALIDQEDDVRRANPA